MERPQNIGIKAMELYFPSQVSPHNMRRNFHYATATLNTC